MISKKMAPVNVTSMRDSRWVYKDPTPPLTFYDQRDHYQDYIGELKYLDALEHALEGANDRLIEREVERVRLDYYDRGLDYDLDEIRDGVMKSLAKERNKKIKLIENYDFKKIIKNEKKAIKYYKKCLKDSSMVVFNQKAKEYFNDYYNCNYEDADELKQRDIVLSSLIDRLKKRRKKSSLLKTPDSIIKTILNLKHHGLSTSRHHFRARI